MPEPAGELWQDLTYASFDDLRLYVRHYKAPDAKVRSVICLPGLTRNARDFHTLATYLSRYAEKPRDPARARTPSEMVTGMETECFSIPAAADMLQCYLK